MLSKLTEHIGILTNLFTVLSLMTNQGQLILTYKQVDDLRLPSAIQYFN